MLEHYITELLGPSYSAALLIAFCAGVLILAIPLSVVLCVELPELIARWRR